MSTLAMRALMNEVKQRRGARLFDLPASGQISASDINVELGRAFNAPFDINGVEERDLAGIPSGEIKFSDFHGKSAQQEFQLTIAADPANPATVFGYVISDFGGIAPITLILGTGDIVTIAALIGATTSGVVNLQWQGVFPQVGYTALLIFDSGAQSVLLQASGDSLFTGNDAAFATWLSANVGAALAVSVNISPI